jgi:hypothetical protein
MQLAVKIRDEGFTLESFIPESCPAYLHQLMLWCWRPKPADRPTFSQIVSFLNENAADRVGTVRPPHSTSNTEVDAAQSTTKTKKGKRAQNAKEQTEKVSTSKNRWTAGVVDPSKVVNEIESSGSNRGDVLESEDSNASEPSKTVYSNFIGGLDEADTESADKETTKKIEV